MPSRALSISLLTLASLLAPGCCCPQLSGRYANRCCQPQMLANANAGADANPGSDAEACNENQSAANHCARRGPFHRFYLTRWFTGLAGDGVPSEQAPEYASPQPKFHPIPTRPAFEPQLAYLPPALIVPSDGIGNPLRSTHGSLHGPLHHRRDSRGMASGMRELPGIPALPDDVRSPR
jgi:hypothetical protein